MSWVVKDKTSKSIACFAVYDDAKNYICSKGQVLAIVYVPLNLDGIVKLVEENK
jgi:hypothetical protein